MSNIKTKYVDEVIDMWFNDKNPYEIAEALHMDVDDVLEIIINEEG